MEAEAGMIALIGYRATGKTRVARTLARRLHCPWHDTDSLVQTRAECTIREIFERDGEPRFRDLENEVIAELCRLPGPALISLGGGAVLREETRGCLRESAVTVWLRAQPNQIWSRMQADKATAEQRPALSSLTGYDEITAVLAQREPVYAQAADFQVHTDNKPVVQIAGEILSLLSGMSGRLALASWLRNSLSPS